MNVAVLSLTRDRLVYTKHCFASLRENAGCSFDHYVLDQASEDGTREWLQNEYRPHRLILLDDNIGVCRGLNRLVDVAMETGDYDVIVGFDNDCELITPNTLSDCAAFAYAYPAIVAPHIRGLNNTPQPTGHTDGVTEVHHLGNIFRAHPAEVFTDYGYRFDESMPPWGGDETICVWFRERGGLVGYLDGYEAWHYETTDGQQGRFPDYFARKYAEMAA